MRGFGVFAGDVGQGLMVAGGVVEPVCKRDDLLTIHGHVRNKRPPRWLTIRRAARARRRQLSAAARDARRRAGRSGPPPGRAVVARPRRPAGRPRVAGADAVTIWFEIPRSSSIGRQRRLSRLLVRLP